MLLHFVSEKMTGVEFAVVLEQPPVYVIQKQKRRGPDPQDVTPLATYYVNGANVYQSPTLYAVIANRLLTSLFHVNSAFQEAHKLMQFQPSKGYTWKTSASISGDNGTATTTEQQKLLTLGSTTKTRSTAPALLRQVETNEFREIIDRTILTAAARVSVKRTAPIGTTANRPDGLGTVTGHGVGLAGGGQTGVRVPTRPGGGEPTETGTPLVPSASARSDDQAGSSSKRRKKTDETTVPPAVKRKKKTSK
ncbi:MED6 mediator sub complex component-domain-containing protein [Endogone sp. FLAS-F59071]|nr:MED6 mediator sub complex component-domain-containing protein [Endogone sp. FLAS-F59071]|eukprot:RUS19597.1 MED6 mediator sub complex component-domain-containing protein [Endogone sp. FLAS-F59071]